jgi:pimeloyl-ACP methyl ester carboxylesterase
MTRWPIAAAALMLLLSACTGPGGGAGGAADRDSDPVLPESEHIDGMFSVGDRELYLTCSGSGEPTILLEGGEGMSSDALYPIRAMLDSTAHVCSYDRANLGQSGEAPLPRTADQVADDLNHLLDAAEVPGPFVLVGHSAGGFFVQHYARAYPDDVRGVVALNPVPPYDQARELMFPLMTEEERAGEVRYFGGDNQEGIDYETSTEELKALKVPDRMPFQLVISTSAQCASEDDICGRSYPGYEQAMEAVAAEWGAEVTEVDAGHELYVDDPEAVLAALDDLLERAGYPDVL